MVFCVEGLSTTGCNMVKLEIWVVYDADGNFEVHSEGASEAMEKYSDEIGGDEPRRCVKVVLKAPEPMVAVLTGEVPEEKQEGTLTVS